MEVSGADAGVDGLADLSVSGLWLGLGVQTI